MFPSCKLTELIKFRNKRKRPAWALFLFNKKINPAKHHISYENHLHHRRLKSPVQPG